MLPSKDDTRWKDLITGKISFSFKAVSAGMIISRLNRKTKRDSSEDNISNCIDEVYEFFQKYESILKDDVNELFK